jgi:hypothetical protein
MAQAPTAWTMRKATSDGALHASAHSTDPAQSTSTPITKTRRRP